MAAAGTSAVGGLKTARHLDVSAGKLRSCAAGTSAVGDTKKLGALGFKRR
jgi:hypothetical protein